MNLVLFFSYGVSLKLWRDTGLIGRELLLYEKFIDEGHRITMITYGDETDLSCYPITKKIKVVPVYAYIKRPENKLLRFVQSLFIPFYFRRLLIEADIFKTNQMMGAWVPVLAKLLCRKKLAVRCGYELFRNRFRNRSLAAEKIFSLTFFYLLEFIAYRLADVIIISSYTDRNYIRRVFGINSKRITILRNFINVDSFRPMEIQKESNAILATGRLTKRKNFSALVKALEGTSLRLDIVGSGHQQEILLSLAEQKKVKLRLLGSLPNDELPYLIGRYPVYIQPSFYENNPKALMEAMSCGVAVIGTDVEGIRELIVHGINGMLCRTDPVSIRKAIIKLIENRQLRDKLGENARKFILKNCSLDQVLKDELKLYNQLIRV